MRSEFLFKLLDRVGPVDRFGRLVVINRQYTLLRAVSIPLLSNQDAGGFLESDGIEKAPFLWEKKAVRMASQAASIAVFCHEE